jgi:hypothetical protein
MAIEDRRRGPTPPWRTDRSGKAGDSRLYAVTALAYIAVMFGQTKRTMKTMTPSDGVARVCAR